MDKILQGIDHRNEITLLSKHGAMWTPEIIATEILPSHWTQTNLWNVLFLCSFIFSSIFSHWYWNYYNKNKTVKLISITKLHGSIDIYKVLSPYFRCDSILSMWVHWELFTHRFISHLIHIYTIKLIASWNQNSHIPISRNETKQNLQPNNKLLHISEVGRRKQAIGVVVNAIVIGEK